MPFFVAPQGSPPAQLIAQAASLPTLAELVAPSIGVNVLGLQSQQFLQYFSAAQQVRSLVNAAGVTAYLQQRLLSGVPISPALMGCVSFGGTLNAACVGRLTLGQLANDLATATLAQVALGTAPLELVGNILQQSPLTNQLGIGVITRVEQVANRQYNQQNGFRQQSGTLFAPFAGAEAFDRGLLWGVGESRCLSAGCNPNTFCGAPANGVKVNLKSADDLRETAEKTFQTRSIPCLIGPFGIPIAWTWTPELPWPADVRGKSTLYLPPER